MIQVIVGVFIYYAIAIDSTILVTLYDIAVEQLKATKKTSQQIARILNYIVTHPLAVVQYHASGMILHIHSNGSYPPAPQACSCAGGVNFLSNAPPPNTNVTTYNPPLKGFIHIVCKIIKVITSTTAETELGTVFINA